MNPPVTESAASRAADKTAAKQAGAKAEKQAAGLVAFVGAGPGDESLLTVRATALLAGADLVVAGPELMDQLGRLVRPGAEIAPVARRSRYLLASIDSNGALSERASNGHRASPCVEVPASITAASTFM